MTFTQSTLETTELLELILLHLPLRHLLLVQQVSHHWQSTILTSPRLRQALYLRPTTTLPPPTTNHRSIQSLPLHTTPHQMLSTPTYSTLANTILRMAGSAAHISHPPPPTTLTLSTAMGYAEASWRAMQLTQPPTAADFLVGNFIALSASEAVGLARDEFIPSDSARVLGSNCSMTHGSFSRLGALRLESADDGGAGGGLTVEMAERGIAVLRRKFGEAEHKGRELRFFWGSQVRAEVMVQVLEEIQREVEGEVGRLQRERAARR